MYKNIILTFALFCALSAAQNATTNSTTANSGASALNIQSSNTLFVSIAALAVGILATSFA